MGAAAARAGSALGPGGYGMWTVWVGTSEPEVPAETAGVLGGGAGAQPTAVGLPARPAAAPVQLPLPAPTAAPAVAGPRLADVVAWASGGGAGEPDDPPPDEPPPGGEDGGGVGGGGGFAGPVGCDGDGAGVATCWAPPAGAVVGRAAEELAAAAAEDSVVPATTDRAAAAATDSAAEAGAAVAVPATTAGPAASGESAAASVNGSPPGLTVMETGPPACGAARRPGTCRGPCWPTIVAPMMLSASRPSDIVIRGRWARIMARDARIDRWCVTLRTAPCAPAGRAALTAWAEASAPFHREAASPARPSGMGTITRRSDDPVSSSSSFRAAHTAQPARC